jgi:two-component system cell cycle sensor histidine kinase/response regulator CckA
MEHVDRLAAIAPRLKAGGIAVVALDLNLPDGRGAESVARVREVDPDVPLVVFTGSGEAWREATDGRVHEFLIKGQVDGRLLDHALRYAMDRAQLERQLKHAQKLESLGRLTGEVAHDFNNLLTVILGNASLLLRQTGAEANRSLLSEVVGAANRAALLTRHLLGYGRKETAALEVLDARDLLSGLAPILARLLGERVVLSVDVNEAPGFVLADRGQLEQVIINFSVNARDAMPDGGTLSLCVRAEHLVTPPSPHLAPGRYVLLNVRDTGTGISPEVLSHVFDPFFTTKVRGKGTGLGLPVAAAIAEDLGGAILVDTEVGRGSNFTLILPAREIPRPSEPDRSEPAAMRGHETILLVEDDQSVRECLIRTLQTQGYDVLGAASAADAVARSEASTDDIALMLSDAVLPEQTGRELWATLKKGRPGLKLLVMTGYGADTWMAREGDVAGRILRKPFSVETLCAFVRDSIDGAPAGSSNERSGTVPDAAGSRSASVAP